MKGAIVVSISIALLNVFAALALAMVAVAQDRPVLWLGVGANVIACIANLFIAARIHQDSL